MIFSFGGGSKKLNVSINLVNAMILAKKATHVLLLSLAEMVGKPNN